MLRFILITLVLLKLVQSIDISSYFSPTPKASKASKVSEQQNIRDALKDSDSEAIATTPLVLMESVSDGNVSEKETDKEKTTSLVETLGR